MPHEIDTKALREELDAATAEVAAAEEALADILGQLRAGVRAEKVTVTTAVESAFTRLRAGRGALARLRDRIDPPG